MKRFNLSRIIWVIGLMLLVSTQIGHAQAWSAWEALNDGNADLLIIRSKTETHAGSASGYTTHYSISNQYASPVSFTVVFVIPVVNSDKPQRLSFKWRLAANTECIGSLDTDTISDVTISGLVVHY